MKKIRQAMFLFITIVLLTFSNTASTAGSSQISDMVLNSFNKGEYITIIENNKAACYMNT